MNKDKSSIKRNLSQAKPILPQIHSSYNLPELFLEKLDSLVAAGEFQTRNDALRMAVRLLLEKYLPVPAEQKQLTANDNFTTSPAKKVEPPQKEQYCHTCEDYEECGESEEPLKACGAWKLRIEDDGEAED